MTFEEFLASLEKSILQSEDDEFDVVINSRGEIDCD